MGGDSCEGVTENGTGEVGLILQGKLVVCSFLANLFAFDKLPNCAHYICVGDFYAGLLTVVSVSSFLSTF